MRRAGLTVAVLLAGCDAGAPASDAARSAGSQLLAWRSAPGGGKVAMVKYRNPDIDYATVDAVRCWAKGDGQDCLVVHWSSLSGFAARRVALASLPVGETALSGLGEAGYGCAYNADHAVTTETIAGPDGRLVEHSWMSFAPKRPWTRGYVAGFMRDNAVAGASWFRCVALLGRLRDGSIDTVGTTVVSRASLG